MLGFNLSNKDNSVIFSLIYTNLAVASLVTAIGRGEVLIHATRWKSFENTMVYDKGAKNIP